MPIAPLKKKAKITMEHKFYSFNFICEKTPKNQLSFN